METQSPEDIAVIGIDIGKETFHLVGFAHTGERVLREKIKRLGLVPRQFSTGGRTILGRINKRGNGYLRMLLVQAANVILMRPHRWDAWGLGPWLRGVVARMPHNKAAVALANKLVRTAWSVLRYGSKYEVERDEALAAI